jgi:hypothetical protein
MSRSGNEKTLSEQAAECSVAQYCAQIQNFKGSQTIKLFSISVFLRIRKILVTMCMRLSKGKMMLNFLH